MRAVPSPDASNKNSYAPEAIAAVQSVRDSGYLPKLNADASMVPGINDLEGSCLAKIGMEVDVIVQIPIILEDETVFVTCVITHKFDNCGITCCDGEGATYCNCDVI